MERGSRFEVFHFLGKGIRETGQPEAVHPQGVVLFFYVIRRDQVNDRIPGNRGARLTCITSGGEYRRC